MKIRALNIRTIAGALVLLFLFSSCSGPTGTSTPSELNESETHITQMVDIMQTDISKNGPVAWLNYFEDSPDFFMASNGSLAFKDYQSADSFIKNVLVKSISKINLKLNNLRVDAYSTDWGAIGASFHEDITDTSGKIIAVDGYFTANAHKTTSGWKLRNLHWSIKPIN